MNPAAPQMDQPDIMLPAMNKLPEGIRFLGYNETIHSCYFQNIPYNKSCIKVTHVPIQLSEKEVALCRTTLS